jgi:putative intracellular protease/amidase
MSVRNVNAVNPKNPKRVGIVISNPTVAATTGWPVGFWWSELTHPYYLMTEAGYQVDVFSPSGGPCQADTLSDPGDASGYSATDLITRGFINTPQLASLVQRTQRVAEMDVGKYDGIVVAGGQAPMFLYEQADDLQKKFVEFYEAGKVACALCHGVSLLRYTRLSTGEHLVKGKTLTGFTNGEEDYADNAAWNLGLLSRDKHVMPWRIEDEMKRLGANYIQAGTWKSFAVRDGNLVTGQQNFSGAATAAKVIQALGE